MEYVLLTPVRNEEKNIQSIARFVCEQKKRPLIWLIVNDGSTDDTEFIIESLKEDFNWIKSLSLPFEPGGLGFHYAKVIQQGFNHLQSLIDHNKYDFIGKVDADIVFDPFVFEKLLREFELDKELGICSPNLVFRDIEKIELGNIDIENKLKLNKSNNDKGFEISLNDHPTDGLRLYRKKCFTDIGGNLPVRAPETVSEAKAILRGWKIRRFDHIVAIHLRKTHASTSLWNRWKMVGSEQYYLGYNPILVLGSIMYDFIYKTPKYLWLAHALGYVKAIIDQDEKICDKEIIDYFSKKRLLEVVIQTPSFIKKILNSFS